MNYVIRYNYVHKGRIRNGNIVVDAKTEPDARKAAIAELRKELGAFQLTSVGVFRQETTA